MKLPTSTETWMVIWGPVLIALRRTFLPDLDIQDEALVTTVIGVLSWVIARITKKQVVKRTNGGTA